MSRLLYSALLLTMIVVLACTGAEPTAEPTATPVPTSTPAPQPTFTPAPTPTPRPTATPTPTPRPTSTPVPTEVPQQQVPTGESINPLPAGNPQLLLAELSQVELTCIAESGDLQGTLTTLQAPELASPEEIEELLLCLRDGTVLRLFLSGLIGPIGPLSGETSACLRAGFTGVDLRSIMLAGVAGGEEGQVMADSMAAFLLAMSCLNEDEWEIAAPAMGMASSDRETLQCVMRELEGPAGVAAALQPADGGPPLTFFAAAIGCGMSTSDLTSMTAPSTTTGPGPSGDGMIAPINLEDPAAFAMELSDTEQSCISETVAPEQLALVLSAPDFFPAETDAITQCFEEETLLRVFITGLIAPTGPLSAETSACVRGGMEGIDLRSMMSSGAEEDQAAMVDGMSAMIVALSCLNDAEWQEASATLGVDPGQRESAQCAIEQLGGPEGLAEALQSEDGSGFIALLSTALACGLQMELGTAPGG